MPEFRCEQCDRVFGTEEALAHHTQAKHTGQPEQGAKPKRSFSVGKKTIIGIIILLIIAAAALFVLVGPGGPSYVPLTSDADNTKGNPDASVTVVEFSDFQCPFCARFYRETLPQIEAEYINTEKIAFIYKHFPIGSHPYAQKAAEAAECAGDQGKLWDMHDAMFDDNAFLSVPNLKTLARNIGLDGGAFDACLDSSAMRARVIADQQEGTRLGVRGTPSFFINGQFISGAQPYAVFKAAIDSKLAAV